MNNEKSLLLTVNGLVSGSPTVVNRQEAMKVYYFGCRNDSGHYLWDRQRRSVEYWDRLAHASISPVPWPRLDGELCDGGYGVQGRARLHHKDGWTALAFADRSIDKRPGSNSAFFFEATFDFEQAVAAARQHFPEIVERFPFEIVPRPS